MKTILITGATSGIGAATVALLAPRYKIVACGRNTKQLDVLKATYPETVHTLTFDVRDKKSVNEAILSLPEAFNNIDILINNAGNAHGLATFDAADMDDLEAMIDINIKGVIYVSKAVIPLMYQSTAPIIINISSIAGKETYMNGTTYCASKAAVEALTKGMRMDLGVKGFRVASIAPGAVATNFSMVRFKGDTERSSKVYEGYEPLQAEDIANSIDYIVSVPDHVQIADLTILPTAQSSATTIHRK